jgi:hypothetical protein
MGGDDLGSDDEQYLTASLIVDDKEGNRAQTPGITTGTPNKRDADVGKDHVDAGSQRKRSKKDVEGSNSDRRNNHREQSRDGAGNLNLFREAAHIINQLPQHQAAFLQQTIHRYCGTSNVDSMESSSRDNLPVIIHPSYFVSSAWEHQRTQEASFLDKLRSAVSTKKLKNWGSSSAQTRTLSSTSPFSPISPCVIVVCLSARRAVSILQELAPLKIRIAKLFPKNGSVREQLDLLRHPGSHSRCSVAVGTPHRLLVLAQELSETARSGGGSGEAVRHPLPMTDQTQLVILDGHLSSNRSTVLTMADTAPHCIKFLVEHVLPQFQSRKDLKLAFF